MYTTHGGGVGVVYFTTGLVNGVEYYICHDKLRYYLLIIEKDLVGHTKYPQVITLLETINQNLKIQNNNLVKLKKKSNTGTKKILKRTNHRSK